MPENNKQYSGLTELAREIHENAKAHGWWDENRSFPEVIALCHSELSEALEEHRNGNPLFYFITEIADAGAAGGYYPARRIDPVDHCGEKPEGIAVEMVDCVIRILDWCGKEGVDADALLQMKHKYNKTRPYKHGGKKC